MRNLPSLAWDAEFLVSGIEKILNQDFFFLSAFRQETAFCREFRQATETENLPRCLHQILVGTVGFLPNLN